MQPPVATKFSMWPPAKNVCSPLLYGFANQRSVWRSKRWTIFQYGGRGL